MDLKLNMVNLFLDLFDRYKEKLYLIMRKNKYSMDQILDFISGYSTVVSRCENYIYETYLDTDYFNIAKLTDLMDVFNDTISTMTCIDYKEWEIIGVKYAICLANYYINNVINGDIDEVEDLYLDIPDKDKPDSYDWEEHGYLGIFNNEI